MNRRRFLKTTATVAATAAMPGFVREVGASTPIRVGIMLPLSKVMTALGDSTLSGLMLPRLPPWIMPTVTMAGDLVTST